MPSCLKDFSQVTLAHVISKGLEQLVVVHRKIYTRTNLPTEHEQQMLWYHGDWVNIYARIEFIDF